MMSNSYTIFYVKGSDGLVVCGTTGENPSMSKEDKLALFTAIAKECGHKGSIIANVGSNDTKASVDFVKKYLKLMESMVY